MENGWNELFAGNRSGIIKVTGSMATCLLADRLLTVFHVYGCQVTGLYAARPKHTHDAVLKFCPCLLICYS